MKRRRWPWLGWPDGLPHGQAEALELQAVDDRADRRHKFSLLSKRMKTQVLALLIASVGLSGCATTSKTQIFVSTPQIKAYDSALRVLVMNGFQILHTDRNSAVITGERPVKNIGTNREGRKLKVTILVEEQGTEAELLVTWTPPQFTFGSFEPERREFVRGLTQVLPNTKISSPDL